MSYDDDGGLLVVTALLALGMLLGMLVESCAVETQGGWARDGAANVCRQVDPAYVTAAWLEAEGRWACEKAPERMPAAAPR